MDWVLVVDGFATDPLPYDGLCPTTTALLLHLTVTGRQRTLSTFCRRFAIFGASRKNFPPCSGPVDEFVSVMYELFGIPVVAAGCQSRQTGPPGSLPFTLVFHISHHFLFSFFDEPLFFLKLFVLLAVIVRWITTPTAAWPALEERVESGSLFPLSVFFLVFRTGFSSFIISKVNIAC